MKKNIFLTGAPSSGKTTIIKKVIKALTVPANGFYTEEERSEGKRVGFVLNSLDGHKGYLAHQDIRSDLHIRRYGVSLENIESITVPSISPVSGQIIILDEIGKMECFSKVFRQAALKALDSSCIVIGTITLGGDEFIQTVKTRDDMEILEVTPDNRDALPQEIIRKTEELLRMLISRSA
ncbi:MAG: nucleoside-triphosphatase [Dissulfurispiraceae bacterium]